MIEPRNLSGSGAFFIEGQESYLTSWYKNHTMSPHKLEQGEAPVPVVDEKSIHAQVKQAKQKQQNTVGKPPVDHSWRCSSIGSTAIQLRSNHRDIVCFGLTVLDRNPQQNHHIPDPGISHKS